MNEKAYELSSRMSFVKQVGGIILLTLATLATVAFFTPGPIQHSSYMGAHYCGTCHSEEYKIWSESPHARAHDILKNEHKNNPACLSCHATGALFKEQSFLPGVQCEACHGAGQYYANLHIKKDVELSKLLFMKRPVSESSCLHCHSIDSKLFSTHKMMKKIDHWSKSSLKGGHGSGITIKSKLFD